MKRKSNERLLATPTAHDTDSLSVENQNNHSERRRKLGKVALHSVETAFSVMTLVQSGNNALAVANEIIHESPATVCAEDHAQVMADAVEKARVEYVQKQVDNLAGLEADRQDHVAAQWHIDTSFQKQTSLYIGIPDHKS